MLCVTVPQLESLVPTTPREDVVELSIRENDDKEECSGDSAIGGLVLANGDPRRDTINYFECRRYIYNDKMGVKDPEVEVPTEGGKVESCPVGSVLWGFKAWDANGDDMKRWINPREMKGVCRVLEKWTVDHEECQEIPVTGGPWEGYEESGFEEWDTIVYCPRDSLAVALTRSLVQDYYQVTSLKCCYVTHP